MQDRPAKAIPYSRQSIDDSDVEAVAQALRSDFVTQGPALGRFEAALAEVTGARYAVAVSSGTAALHLSCLGLGIGAGHYGLVPAITFAATANCLRYAGAQVAFCDVDPRSGRAGPEQFQQALDSGRDRGELKALLPVSFAGAVPDLETIAQLARKEGAFVIEDAAHSIGARYGGADGAAFRSGSCAHSDAAILSFHPVKHICAAEGGAVLTNDETLARRARRLRSHGIDKGEGWGYDQAELGFHYRMTELQAALGASQLGKLDVFLQRRRALALRYQRAFSAEPFASRLRIANADPNSAWHLFVVHFADADERRAAYAFLHERNIRVQVHYFPVYRNSYYEKQGHSPLPGAERFYSTCLSLPLFPRLTDGEQDYVIASLRSFFKL